MDWKNLVKRRQLKEEGVPEGIIDRFEIERPEGVTKMNPAAKNSPRLYNRKMFDEWVEKDIRAQHIPIRRGVM